MTVSLFKAILILPGTVLVIVPGLIVWASAGTSWAVRVANPAEFLFWTGVTSAALGLTLAAVTMRDFQRISHGTPAPGSRRGSDKLGRYGKC